MARSNRSRTPFTASLLACCNTLRRCNFTDPQSRRNKAAAQASTGAPKALADGGWVGPTLERDLLGDHQKWTREAAVGYRAKEEQELHIWFGDPSMARDVKGAAVPVGYSVVRIMCGGLDVERLEYPER